MRYKFIYFLCLSSHKSNLHNEISIIIDSLFKQSQLKFEMKLLFDSKDVINHQFNIYLFMILKRFFSLALQTRSNLQQFPNSFLLSSKKQKHAQAEPATEQVAQQVAAEQVASEQVAAEASQQVERKRFNKSIQPYYDHKDQVEPADGAAYIDAYEHQIAFEYMNKKQSEIDQKKIMQSLEKVKTKEQMKQKILQLIQQFERQKEEPIKNYQKRLNLIPKNIINSAYGLNGKRRDNRLANIDFKKLKVADFNIQYKQGLYNNLNSEDLIAQVIKTVTVDYKKAKFLNIIYIVVSSLKGNVSNSVASAKDIAGIVNLIKQGQLAEVNPLKLYWSFSKMNNKQSITELMKQLSKIQVNGEQAEAQIKKLTNFYIGKDLSIQILSKIISIAPSLQQTMKIWLVTLCILSRIQKIESATNWKQKVISFNDIFKIQQDNALGNQFLFSHFPKILFESGRVNLYQIYTKALKTNLENNSTLKTHTSDLQQQLQIIFRQSAENKVEITYSFDEDYHDVVVQLTQKKMAQNWAISQLDLVENIIKGKYEKALQFYVNNFCEQEKEKQKLYLYSQQSKAFYDEKSSQALFTLKNVIKSSLPNFEMENFALNDEKLQKFLNNEKNNNRNYRNDRQERKNRGGDRRVKHQERNKNDDPVEQNQEPQESQTHQVQIQSEGQVEKKPVKEKKKLFGQKKISQGFCTIKQKNEDETISKQQSSQHYENYRKIVKETEKNIEDTSKPSSKVIEFNFDKYNSIEEMKSEFAKNIPEFTSENIEQLLKTYNQVAILGDISVLFKYYFFLNLSEGIKPQQIKELQVQFSSSFGDISKNYAEYLKGCIFMLELPNSLYLSMLEDQLKKPHRHGFKRVVAHLLLFKKNVSDEILIKICQICEKQKIGLTLLQIINLINTRGTVISYQSLKNITGSIQIFKNMQSDLIKFVKSYCDRSNLPMKTQLFSPYIKNLTFTQRYQTLNSFLSILQNEYKPKQYKIDQKLSAEQNIKAQKLYRQKQSLRLNMELFQMIKIVSNSLKPRTQIPQFIIQLFDIYMNKKKGNIGAEEFAAGLVILSQNQDKFLEMLNKLKESPKENNQEVFNSLIRAMLLFGRNLKDHVEKILKITLYQNQYQLKEDQLKNFGYIFRDLDIPGSFGEYLEYVLKTQPPITQEIKNLYYKVFNKSSDDHSKNQISGLLDFIFNPSREKDRAQYKKVKIEEERKSKILKQISEKKVQPQNVPTKQEKVKTESPKKQGSELGEQQIKKKSKKEQKKQKKLKGEQKKTDKAQKDTKTEIATSGSNDNSNVGQVYNPEQAKYKKQAKILQKLTTCFTYDHNKRPLFHQKLWKRDLRKKGTVMFIQNFMQNFDGDAGEQASQKPEVRGKKLKQQEKAAAKASIKQGKK